jgi:hypothetical protein
MTVVRNAESRWQLGHAVWTGATNVATMLWIRRIVAARAGRFADDVATPSAADDIG